MSEQQLEIKKAEEKTYDTGREGWSIIFNFPAHPNVDGAFFNLLKPMDGDADRTQRMFVERIQAFVKAFKITSNDVETWVGKVGYGKVGVETYEGKDRNTVESFTVPK